MGIEDYTKRTFNTSWIQVDVTKALMNNQSVQKGEPGKWGFLVDPTHVRFCLAYSWDEFPYLPEEELLTLAGRVIKSVYDADVAADDPTCWDFRISSTQVKFPAIDGDRLEKFAWETLDHWDLDQDHVGNFTVYLVMELTEIAS